MMETIGHPHGTPADRLISEISKQDDISYLYVTHDLQSGFVTHKKEKNDDPIVKHEESQYISVYSDEIAAWRKALNLGNNHNILVAFALCSDADLHMAGMFPEYMACNTTFGVTK